MLPPGWVEKTGKTGGKPYYYHEASGTCSAIQPTSSSLSQQAILTHLAAPFSPLVDAACIVERDVPVAKTGKTKTKSAKIKTLKNACSVKETASKGKKKEKETASKAIRKKYPKTLSTSALVVDSTMVAKDPTLAVFEGATIHDLGGGCAIVSFMDPCVKTLLPAAVEFVSQPGVLEFDRQFKMFNLTCTRSRGEGFFTDAKIKSYAFSKSQLMAQQLHHTLRALLTHVNTFVPGDNFTAVMVNKYRTIQKDGIARHSDDDVSPEEKMGVVAVSYGASRILSFRPIDRHDTTLRHLNIATESGQTLVMYGKGFQDKFSHAIAAIKPTKKNGGSLEGDSTVSAADEKEETARVSFTFRRHHASTA